MINISIISRIKTLFTKPDKCTQFKLVNEIGNGFYIWNGKIFESDIVRSCIRPTARNVGKLEPKHIRGDTSNPDAYMRFLLSDPNPYMSQQQLQEKLCRQLLLNNNAFALIVRDENEFPIAIYPINAVSGEALYDDIGNLYIKFYLQNGKQFTFSYSDIIHLRQDFNSNDVFGSSPVKALAPLMEIVGTMDKGIVSAINNGSAVKWLLRFTTAMRPEDLKRQAKEFSNSYLSSESDGSGVAAVDSKAEAKQITPNDYVPNASQMDRTTRRIYNLFGIDENIIQSKYDENQWNAYYENIIEPIAIDLSNEYTRKLFTRKQRGYGNRIIFESMNLQYASMATKLNLTQLVDRGIMTPNEVRKVINFPPIDGGDVALLRKDTGTLNGGENI